MKKEILRLIKSQIALAFGLDFLYGRKSFSQEGEDLIIEKLFDYKKKGLYVDVGAHHPYRYSNTQKLYKKGWRGINIDPITGTKSIFKKARKRDVNLEMAIGDGKKKTFYIFADQALNTFSPESAKRTIKTGQSQLVKKSQIKTKRLSYVLDKYIKPGQKIDFFNIDAEGAEMEILHSNNWRKYKPEIIAVEILPQKDRAKGESKVYNFLIKKHYKRAAETINTCIFKKNS